MGSTANLLFLALFSACADELKIRLSNPKKAFAMLASSAELI